MTTASLTTFITNEELNISRIKTVEQLKKLARANQKITYEEFKTIIHSFSKKELEEFEKAVSNTNKAVDERFFKDFASLFLKERDFDIAWIFYQKFRRPIAEKYATCDPQKDLSKIEKSDTQPTRHFT